MKDKHFKELLRIVSGEAVSDVQGNEVKELVEELLRGEFKNDIVETKIKIDLRERPGERALAEVATKDGKITLWINPKNWENNPDFAKGGSLRALCRHELLHCALNEAGDDDPIFKMVARQKGIDIWDV